MNEFEDRLRRAPESSVMRAADAELACACEEAGLVRLGSEWVRPPSWDPLAAAPGLWGLVPDLVPAPGTEVEKGAVPTVVSPWTRALLWSRPVFDARVFLLMIAVGAFSSLAAGSLYPMVWAAGFLGGTQVLVFLLGAVFFALYPRERCESCSRVDLFARRWGVCQVCNLRASARLRPAAGSDISPPDVWTARARARAVTSWAWVPAWASVGLSGASWVTGVGVLGAAGSALGLLAIYAVVRAFVAPFRRCSCCGLVLTFDGVGARRGLCSMCVARSEVVSAPVVEAPSLLSAAPVAEDVSEMNARVREFAEKLMRTRLTVPRGCRRCGDRRARSSPCKVCLAEKQFLRDLRR